MDFASDASFFASTSSLDDEITRFLDDMSPADPQSAEISATTYDCHRKRSCTGTPSPQWAQDAFQFPSRVDPLLEPWSLPEYAPSPSTMLTYCVSPSDTVSDACSPHSDITLVSSPTSWGSPSEDRFEDSEVGIQPNRAQSYYHFERPIYPPEPHRADVGEPLRCAGMVLADPLAMREDPAVAYRTRDTGKGELQHDGWHAAAPYDSLLPRHVEVDVDTSAAAPTFPVSPGSGPVPKSPQSQSKRGASRETSSPDDSSRACKGKPYACEYDGCVFDTDRANNLAQHVKDVHLKLRPHECPVCSTPFKRKSDLKRHHISYHTDQGSPRRKDADGKTATARKKSN